MSCARPPLNAKNNVPWKINLILMAVGPSLWRPGQGRVALGREALPCVWTGPTALMHRVLCLSMTLFPFLWAWGGHIEAWGKHLSCVPSVPVLF